MADTETQLETESRPSSIIDIRADVIVRVALLGLGIGAVAWALALGLNQFIIGPVFCPNATCESTSTVSGNIVLVLTAIAAMLGMVRLGVYRPMLIAIAVVATLWGIGGWLSGIIWYEALGWSALMYMAAYTAYAWLVRPRNFIIVLVVLALLIVGIRYLATL